MQRIGLVFLAFILGLGCVGLPVLAQTTSLNNWNTGLKSQKSHIYERPTISKFSQLYWALGKFELTNDEAVDNYLRINECDIYRDYHHNEFEWKQIRESGRKFLEENKKKFPLRYEFTQPLRFAEYNLQKQEFEIWDIYAIDGNRSFEVQASDTHAGACGSGDRDIKEYPRGLNVELSRPFTLKSVPVSKNIAERYILDKSQRFKTLKAEQQSQKLLYEMRDAYMVMHVKIYAYKEDIRTPEFYLLAKVLGTLESFDIYADKELRQLLYSENTNKKRDRSDRESELKKKYQERLKKKMEEDRKKAEQTGSASPPASGGSTSAPVPAASAPSVP